MLAHHTDTYCVMGTIQDLRSYKEGSCPTVACLINSVYAKCMDGYRYIISVQCAASYHSTHSFFARDDRDKLQDAVRQLAVKLALPPSPGVYIP